MKFILVTRFSIREDYLYKNVVHGAGFNNEKERDAWLTHRILLFNGIALPSLSGQVLPPDAWFILCDEGDKDKVLKDFCFDLPYAKIIYLKPFEGGNKDLDEAISQEYKALFPDESCFAVTRFDSDDALACDFYNVLREKCLSIRDDCIYVTFENGVIWDGEKIHGLKYPYNAFSTVILSANSTLELYSLGHNNIKEKKNILLGGESFWMQTVSGINVFNANEGLFRLCQEYQEISHLGLDFLKARFNLSSDALAAVQKSREYAKLIKEDVVRVKQLSQFGDKLRKLLRLLGWESPLRRVVGRMRWVIRRSR